MNISSDFLFFFPPQEYDEILVKRIQQLQKIRNRPDQFTILVREIPICSEHKARGCSVDHFFSKHYPYSYHSYQMVYKEKDLEVLLVSFEWFEGVNSWTFMLLAISVFAVFAFSCPWAHSFLLADLYFPSTILFLSYFSSTVDG